MLHVGPIAIQKVKLDEIIKWFSNYFMFLIQFCFFLHLSGMQLVVGEAYNMMRNEIRVSPEDSEPVDEEMFTQSMHEPTLDSPLALLKEDDEPDPELDIEQLPDEDEVEVASSELLIATEDDPELISDIPDPEIDFEMPDVEINFAEGDSEPVAEGENSSDLEDIKQVDESEKSKSSDNVSVAAAS